MKGYNKQKGIYFYLPVLFVLFLTSCMDSGETTSIADCYENPEISSYQVKKIALLPILPDDTTNIGAFYATNHLYNILDEQDTSLILADIDWVREFDCSFVDKQIDNISRTSQFDIDSFYNSKIGYDLIEDGYDAVLMGTIDSIHISPGTFIGSHTMFGWRTFCKFTYYLMSLKDGKILWKADVNGEEIWETKNFYLKEIPPVDAAISNGIDIMIDVLPKGIFKIE